MIKKILITGAKGFIGSNLTKHFKSLGYETYGIGHGGFSIEESKHIGLDYWETNDITIKAILRFGQKFDVIIHCGGSGSVNFSVNNPYEDFKKTVDGTLEILEYIRVHNSNAHLIYPSSPAVQGQHPDSPIREDYVGKPVSPYGYHKKIAEDLCQSYSEKFNLKISIIRLFSVYGNGLKKQLLWDACHKIMNAGKTVEFWGTGEETRDFIHINDVAELTEKTLLISDRFTILNGGSGIRHTISSIIDEIRNGLHIETDIIFNKKVDIGNPNYYWADIARAKSLNWTPKILLKNGIKEYIQWTKQQKPYV
jgi:UDP-glucose 4-epimerase